VLDGWLMTSLFVFVVQLLPLSLLFVVWVLTLMQ